MDESPAVARQGGTVEPNDRGTATQASASSGLRTALDLDESFIDGTA